MEPNLHNEGRAEVILRHALTLFQHQRLSWKKISEDVVAEFERQPRESRTLVFQHSRDVDNDMEVNGLKLHKIFNRNETVRPPIEVEEAVVTVLERFGAKGLVAELTQRFGYFAVPIPRSNDDSATVGSFTKETGDVLIAIGSMMADGKLDSGDRKEGDKALTEIDEALAALLSLRYQVSTKVMGNPA